MKITRSLILVLTLAAGLLGGVTASAHEGHDHAAAAVEYTGKGQLIPVNEKTDAAWLAKARANYPLNSCVVSGDELEGSDMGPPREFVYKEDGKPDRLVRFCCKDCAKDFNKEPVKYLKVIDDAAAKKARK